ncbi:MAG TPA: amidohydrolase family protein [Candidatus Aquilonibacter sp.]|nr:amidohydrolase family protein [Candidatus Aquilonibacter sp.]
MRSAVERGASGVAIDFATASFSDALAIAREAAQSGAPRAVVTLPNEGDAFLDGVADAISLAERASVAVHVANHHVMYPGSSGRMERSLEAIDRARTRGAAVTIDIAPYVATWTTLASLLPAPLTPSMLDDDTIAAGAALQLQARLGEHWSDFVLAEVSSEERMEWCGMRIDEIARQTWRSPARTVIELIRDEGERARVFWFCLREDDVATALSADFCAIGTAAASYAISDRPYGLVHPRAFGSFPRVFGRFVRQRRALTLTEAVRRMTSLPASIFGLHDAGRLEVDAPADVVVFDEDLFADTATYERPFSLPIGLHRVFRRGVELALPGGPA